MKAVNSLVATYRDAEANLYKRGLVREGVFNSQKEALEWARRRLSSWTLIPYIQVGCFALFSAPPSYLNPVYYDGTGTIFPGEKLK